MSTKIKFFIAVVLIALVAGIGYYFLFSQPDKAGNTLVDNTFGWKFPIVKFPITGSGSLAYSDIRDPGGIPQGLPVRLKIPVISVDSAIEDAFITPDGRMDVPAGSVNVAWFALGPHPGDVGSAVIGGHFGINNGVKFVFYDLDKLKVGDKIYVVNDKGETLAFQVRRIQSFDRNGDATTVFTSSDGIAHLNLITCEGIWNQVNGNYPQRLVVFTDAIPAEGSAPGGTVATPAPAGASTPAFVFKRSLTIGSTGPDVVALQTFLEQRGLLSLPPGMVNGYYGALTKAAVAKYQTSAGLVPSIGFFGPMTRAKVALDLSGSSAFPNTGVDSFVTSVGVTAQAIASTTAITVAMNLFATPLNTLITLLLLVALGFIVYKIFRRR